MGDIVSLFPVGLPKEDEGPFAQGEVFCIGCNHVWQAVAPVGTTQLECPGCGASKGRWRFEFAPNEGQLVRECNCGNQLFYLTPEGHLCANCGTYQRYD